MDDVGVKKLVGGLQATDKSVVGKKVCTSLFVCGRQIFFKWRRPRLKSVEGKEGAKAFVEAGATRKLT